MEVIPSIDLRAGRVVRLEQGDFGRESVFPQRPEEAAVGFLEAGARWVHVVDLDGARDGQARGLEALEAIREAAPGLRVQCGGGVRSLADVARRLELGAERVVVGTAALETPELFAAAALRFESRLVLGLDARDGRVATRGWSETPGPGVEELLERFAGLPLAAVLHTDIGRDGMLRGPNLEACESLARRSPFPLLASGGVSSIEDLEALARTRVIAGAIVGRALYTGAVELAQAIRRVATC
jgi:phosphoribosylformimino-5-aminoimidazole carboxamide ribotide isomerase